MINSNKLLALAASIVCVAEAIPILPECIVTFGNIIGSPSTNSIPFTDAANFNFFDTEMIAVGAE